MCVAQPWTIPSSDQLLEALRRYESLVSTSPGCVSKEQYMETRVWLDEGERGEDDDRRRKIKEVSGL